METGSLPPAGTMVRLVNMPDAAAYNGQVGVLEQVWRARGSMRACVALCEGGKHVKVKPGNVQPVQVLRGHALVLVRTPTPTDLNSSDHDFLLKTLSRAFPDVCEGEPPVFAALSSKGSIKDTLEINQCMALINYVPPLLAKLACLNPSCMKSIPDSANLCVCSGCLMPRYCSAECAESDVAHTAGGCKSVHSHRFWSERALQTGLDSVDEVCAKFHATFVAPDPVMRAAAAVYFDTCAHCGLTDSDAVSFSCHQCKCVRYCGMECFQKHWKASHKKVCAPLGCVLTDYHNVRLQTRYRENLSPMPHDKGGVLLKKSQRAWQLVKNHGARDCTQTRAARGLFLEEAGEWLALGDSVGAGKAHVNSGMVAGESLDCAMALLDLREAKRIFRGLPITDAVRSDVRKQREDIQHMIELNKRALNRFMMDVFCFCFSYAHPDNELGQVLVDVGGISGRCCNEEVVGRGTKYIMEYLRAEVETNPALQDLCERIVATGQQGMGKASVD